MNHEIPGHKPDGYESASKIKIENESPSLFEKVMGESSSASLPSKAQFTAFLQNELDYYSKSLPAKPGESYEQVLGRMFPYMEEKDLKLLSHDSRALNGEKSLADGEQFQLLSEFGKDLLKSRALKKFDQKISQDTNFKQRAKFSSAYEQVINMLSDRIVNAAGLPAGQAAGLKSPKAAQRFDFLKKTDLR